MSKERNKRRKRKKKKKKKMSCYTSITKVYWCFFVYNIT